MSVTNIIEVTFGDKTTVFTKPYFKYNSKMYYQFTDLDLPTTYQVHFANAPKGTSIEMLGNSDGVEIPDNVWQSGKNIYAWIYLHPTDDSAITKYEVQTPVLGRADLPDGVTPTPSEQTIIDQLISELNTAVDQTSDDVQTTTQKAQEASDSADDAQGYADDAQGYANDASGYANTASTKASEASTSAQNASTSESNARTYAQNASTSEGNAQTYADNAAESARQAQASANSASGYATSASSSASTATSKAREASVSAQTASDKASEASTSASNASDSADDASGYATTAQGYANDASGYATTASQAKTDAEDARDDAQTAQGLAETAQAAAELAQENAEDAEEYVAERMEDVYKSFPTKTATSGSIVTFDDGADNIPLKSMIVDIDPVQDLNGYDHPWVGGGGRNKFDLDNATLAVGYSGAFRKNGYNAVTVYKTSTGIASDEKNSNCGRAVCLGLLSADTYIVSFVNQGHESTTFSVVYTDTNVLPDNGAIERTTVISAQSQSIQFEADGTHYYWLSAYYRDADNYKINDIMLRKSTEADASFAPYSNICPISGWDGMQLAQTGKNLFSVGEYTLPSNSMQNTIWSGNLTGTFTITIDKSGITSVRTPTSSRFCGIVVDGVSVWIPYAQDSETVTGNITRIMVYGSNGYSGAVGTIKVQLEVGSSATAYETYTGRSITIDLGQTVYGGTLDVLTGKLTVTQRYFDGGDVTWNKVSDYAHGNFFINTNPLANYSTSVKKVISSAYKSAVNNTVAISGDNFVWVRSISSVQRRIYVKDTSKASITAEEFQTAMTGVQFVYELATPIEIQLTPTEVRSLLGLNHIFVNTGDTSVVYRVDPTENMDDLFDELESNVSHYPKIENDTWWVWDATNNTWVDTEVEAQGEQGETYTLTTADKEEIADLVEDGVLTANILKAFPTDTASGAVASFTDGANLPLKSLVVGIEPSQDTSGGDPSPSNICSISGWTGANIDANGTTIAVDWTSEAGTVYGGKLDVLTGKLTITHTYTDLIKTGWTLSGSNFWHSYSSMSNTNPANIGWCTHYANETKITGNNTIIFGYSSFSGSPRIVVRDSRFTSASDFMAYLQAQETNGTPVMIAYPLAEPIEYQLTAQEVSSLYGNNSIYADCGDTTVEYRADPTLYIQRLTVPDSEDMIADANITSGQYFMVGNSLYIATANIANGSAIVVGTNCTRKSLAEALNEINA